jgi:hypothetical protein
MPTELRNFLAIPYDELEEMNLNARNNARIVLPFIRFKRSASNT